MQPGRFFPNKNTFRKGVSYPTGIKQGINANLSGLSRLTTDSIGAQCPTASSLPLLSGHGQNNTVLSGQPRPAPALVGAAGAAPAFVGAGGDGVAVLPALVVPALAVLPLVVAQQGQ